MCAVLVSVTLQSLKKMYTIVLNVSWQCVPVRLIYGNFGVQAQDLSRELRNALWHLLTQQQLDPSASY